MNDKEIMDYAKGLVSLIREQTVNEFAEKDRVITCGVERVHEDGTLDLYVYPDRNNTITRVVNQCRYDFSPGDSCILYIIQGVLSNSFVVAKCNPDQLDVAGYQQYTKDFATKQNELISGQNIKTINNNSMLGPGNIDITSIKQTGQVVLAQGDWAIFMPYICQKYFEILQDSDVILFFPNSDTDKTNIEQANIFTQATGPQVVFTAKTVPSVDITLNYCIIGN